MLLLVGANLQAPAQMVTWSPDSASRSDPNFGMQRYHEVLRYHDPLMYLVFPVVKPIKERKVALEDGEGKDGFWLEGHLGYRFSIFKGQFYSPRFIQRTRLTLDVTLHSMLTRDQSSPILPFNTKVGPGLDFLLSSLDKLKQERSGLCWTSLQFHHYSNGQADTFFIESPFKRNNYKSGNFSTNYWRLLLHAAINKKNLLIGSLGYQREVDIGGPLGRSAELKNYYGDGRILFQLNWIKKPSLVTKHYVNRSSPAGETIEKEKRRQLGIRTELEYITGDLSAFPGERKYRLGIHNYITYMPSVTNEVGFIAHSFVGRHYLNMRFDDINFVGSLGLYVKFNGN
jgi:hypothetical protein